MPCSRHRAHERRVHAAACAHTVVLTALRSCRLRQVELLIGDPAKAKHKLGWEPTTKMEDLCAEMVRSDIALVEKGDMTS